MLNYEKPGLLHTLGWTGKEPNMFLTAARIAQLCWFSSSWMTWRDKIRASQLQNYTPLLMQPKSPIAHPAEHLIMRKCCKASFAFVQWVHLDAIPLYTCWSSKACSRCDRESAPRGLQPWGLWAHVYLSRPSLQLLWHSCLFHLDSPNTCICDRNRTSERWAMLPFCKNDSAVSSECMDSGVNAY